MNPTGQLSSSEKRGLGLILVLAIGIRVLWIQSKWLGYDELFSANFAHASLFDLFISTLRFDVHPPMHTLQLKFWMMLGTSDLWLMLNSVAWSVGGVASLFWVSRRFYGTRPALAAALFMALAPVSIVYGFTVRPYASITTLAIWAWYFNARAMLKSEPPGWKDALWIAAVEIGAIYSHSIGLLMISGAYAFALAQWAATRNKQRLVWWTMLHLLIGVLTLPVLVFATSKGADHPVVPGLTEILRSGRLLIVGGSIQDVWWMAAFAAVLAGLACIQALFSKEARRVGLCLVVVPLAVNAGISILVRPVWLTRSVSAVVPFFCLTLALGIWCNPQLEKHLRRGKLTAILLTGAVTAILMVVAVRQQYQERKGDGIKLIANVIRSEMKPGDWVLDTSDELRLFALLWYLGGPDWGNALDMHPDNPKWQRVLDRLGPVWSRRLHLISSKTATVSNGVTITGTFAPYEGAQKANRVFVISFPNTRTGKISGVAPNLPGHSIQWHRNERGIDVALWTMP